MSSNPSLWFCVPAHGRLRLTEICLRQLRRTCDTLSQNGVHASAVVVADDANLDVADELGFATVRRDNYFVSRKFNDGIHLAMDERYNPLPADYVVPCGSDDWVDWRLFTRLPASDTLVAFRTMSFVSEDATEIKAVNLSYQGGSGIRIWPRQLLATVGFRPAAESLRRGCDMSMFVNVTRATGGFQVEYRDTDPTQIVDWKSHDTQVNPYAQVTTRWRSTTLGDPFLVLARRYPAEALEEMRAHYAQSVAA